MPSRNRHKERERKAHDNEIQRQRDADARHPDAIWREYERAKNGCNAVGERHCSCSKCCICGRWTDD